MIRKFKAPTMKNAMAMAKDYFGDDAVVLESKKVPGDGPPGSDDDEMVEITVSASTQKNDTPRPRTRKPFYTPADLRPKKATVFQKQGITIESKLDELEDKITGTSDSMGSQSKMPLLPKTSRFLSKKKGVDDDLALEIVHRITLRLKEVDFKNEDKIKDELHAEIINNIKTRHSLNLPTEKPKVICLVGPTGMGKTTSIIKLATNPSFYGSKRVAIITIDTYRVAAAAQLKTFAVLANLPLEIVYRPTEFAAAINKFKDHDVVLVDTAGRSPLNSQHMEDLQLFFQKRTPDEIHLVLSVSMHSDILRDTVSNFSSIPVNRIIISKIDETHRLGNILNVGSKVRVPISFLTNGQKVPDDIHLADKFQIANMIVN